MSRYDRMRDAFRREALRRAGICIKCRKAPSKGKAKCRACVVENYPHQRAARRLAVANGVCNRCHRRKVAKGRRKCPYCLLVSAAQARRYRAEVKAIIAADALSPEREYAVGRKGFADWMDKT